MKNKTKKGLPPFLQYLKKETIIREISLIINTYGDDKKKDDIKDEFFNGFDEINSNLIYRINEIIEVCGLNPILIRARKASPNIPLFDGDIENYFGELSDPSNLRIIINLEKIKEEEIHESISKQPISHLVEICLFDDYEKDNDNLVNFKVPTTRLYPAPKQLTQSVVNKVNRIIEDVLLDISLYHTLIVSHHKDDLEFRRKFSQLKVEYVKKKKIAEGKKTIWNSENKKGYLSLAGYFWKDDKFDVKGYVDSWIELRNELFGSEIGIPSIEEQIKRHTDEKKLSSKKYVRLYEELPPGQYFFARIYKKPNSNQLCILQALFGGKGKPEIGNTRFFHYDRITDFNKVKNCVSFFMVIK